MRAAPTWRLAAAAAALTAGVAAAGACAPAGPVAAGGPATTTTTTAPVSVTVAPPGPTPWLPAGPCHVRYAGGQALPDPACTPGAVNPAVTQAAIHATICRAGWTATVRPPVAVTDRLKAASIRAYGYANHQPGAYEEDHLVPLELGGDPGSAADARNLWAEPGASPNAKDKVEGALNRAVCAGRVPLAAAQAAIAVNWTTAERAVGLG